MFEDDYCFIVHLTITQRITKSVLSNLVSRCDCEAVMEEHNVVCPVYMLVRGAKSKRAGKHQYRERLNRGQTCQQARAAFDFPNAVCGENRQADRRQEQITVVDQIALSEDSNIEHRYYWDHHPGACECEHLSLMP